MTGAFEPFAFQPVADGVLVARTQPLDVNTTLVLGDTSALVVDTLSTEAQALALLAAIRAVTPLPLIVLNTHHHFDHCFGNAVLAAQGAPVWAHERAADTIAVHGPASRESLRIEYGDRPAFAQALALATIHPPTHRLRDTARLDLGGRVVTVTHPGYGHTDGDVFAHVPDADVIVAGDLVEEGATPSFGDAYPLDWPEAVAALLRPAGDRTVFVPGHGAPVRTGFVTEQHARLAEFAWLIREGHGDGAPADAVAARAPWPADECRDGVERGYAFLDDPATG